MRLDLALIIMMGSERRIENSEQTSNAKKRKAQSIDSGVAFDILFSDGVRPNTDSPAPVEPKPGIQSKTTSLSLSLSETDPLNETRSPNEHIHNTYIVTQVFPSNSHRKDLVSCTAY